MPLKPPHMLNFPTGESIPTQLDLTLNRVAASSRQLGVYDERAQTLAYLARLIDEAGGSEIIKVYLNTLRLDILLGRHIDSQLGDRAK